MATAIQALERGGYSVFGSGFMDDRTRAVCIQADEDEAHPITVTMPSAIATVTEDEGGAYSSTPAISGSTFTATITNLTTGGRVEYLITLSSGEIRRLRILASPAYGYRDRDYGWGI